MNRERRTWDVVVVGGGVVGNAIAHELSKYDLRTLVLDKEHDVAEGISKANSGVLHAGLMVPPGTQKARLNVEGRKYFPALTDKLGVPFENCRKLIVAKNEREKRYLYKLLDNGEKSGVPGLSLIDSPAIEHIEPNVDAEWAILSEGTSVILPYLFAIALAENAVLNGVYYELNTEVVALQTDTERGPLTVRAADGREFTASVVVNAAGLGADRVAKTVEKSPETVYPWRGEYHLLAEESSAVVSTAVYPVPPQDGAGLGVHITPTVNGGILLGPSASPISRRDDTGNDPKVLAQLMQEAHELVPRLKGIPVTKNYAGIRPKLFGPDSTVRFKDFHIAPSEQTTGLINLLGIESPGLTAAPAIATYVVEQLISDRLALREKREWSYRREPIPRLKHTDDEEMAALVQQDRAYADIVCHCERVSRAEVRSALQNPLGAVSLNAIRKRTHATLGRCQSGFCLANMASIVEERTGATASLTRGGVEAPVFFGQE